VWVNVPTTDHNANFVEDDGPPTLDVDAAGRLVIDHHQDRFPVQLWTPPRYHGEHDHHGRPYNRFAFTHGDRVRISPLQGCGMVCKFCNIPYEDRYATKPVDALLDAVRVALDDPWQPARHVLISGGTPRTADIDYLRDVYVQVLRRFPDTAVDIMMVPVDGLLDVAELADLGLNELSINIELVNAELAARHMRQKLDRGLDHYLRFIEAAATTLGQGRVRSMLMVGLEPVADTLRGVQLIVDAGGVPVLSPFRPDPATPLAATPPPTAAEMQATFVAARDIVRRSGAELGPSCPPCTHNTMTLLGPDPAHPYALPVLT
jgi:hypothetical protein